jgi:hypothetical protein
MTDETPEQQPQPPQMVILTEEEKRARDKRNRAIALGLVGFTLLIFGVTVLRLASNIAAN